METTFTPYSALAGGVLIGLAASALLYFNGRIAGISGMFHGTLRKQHQLWQFLFLLGLVIGALLYFYLGQQPMPVRQGFPVTALIFGGLLVGAGTRLGSGCTSGHGICGISRGSWRSISATLIFMGTGFITTYICRHILGL